MVIKGYRVGQLLKKTAREIGEDSISSLSASAAYNFFFSLFPLLLFLTPLLTVAVDKRRLTSWMMNALGSVLPPVQVDAFRPILDKVLFPSNARGLMSIGLVLAAWSGSNIFGTLMGALNTAYDVHETRSWIKQQLIRLLALGVGAVIVVASTIVFLDGERVAAWLGAEFGLGSAAVLIWTIVQFPLAIAAVVALAFITYMLLPNVTPHKMQVLVVSCLTTTLWILATLLFRLYVNHFPPNPAYGLIGGVIILLTWMYYTMFVVLIGGELASELHHGTGAIAPDKGAIYLGRVVTSAGPGSTSAERGASSH